jgi:xylulokinase
MYFIGLDIGTSSVKALLVSIDGSVVRSATPEYSFQTPKPLWAETDPEVWWEATCKAIRSLLVEVKGSEIAAVGLTGQMHGMVALDAKGRTLRSCIMWNDQRSFRECEEITRTVGESEVLRITGNPVLAGFTAPKVLWVKNNEPEVFSSIDKIVLPKDYIRYKLSSEFFTDVSDASGTSLLDVGNRKWSSDMLDALGWAHKWMPEVTESTEATAKVSEEASALTGLAVGTPIIAGGGDQAAQAVGCGIVREGMVSATLGTSGVVFAQSDEYRVEPEGKLHAFCHAVPGKWHLMGVMLSAAGSFQWYKNQLGAEEQRMEDEGGANAYDSLSSEAEKVSPGSEGLIFLPYLSGERTPYPDPYARGCFIGLSVRHQKRHMTRSVLEGVSFGLNDSLELMRALGVNPKEIVLSGGGTRSALWKQMLADVFSSRCTMVNALEGAAYGAAVLSAVGSGAFASVEDACDQWIRQTEVVEPSAECSAYEKFYSIYRSLYPSLQDTFRALAEDASS